LAVPRRCPAAICGCQTTRSAGPLESATASRRRGPTSSTRPAIISTKSASKPFYSRVRAWSPTCMSERRFGSRRHRPSRTTIPTRRARSPGDARSWRGPCMPRCWATILRGCGRREMNSPSVVLPSDLARNFGTSTGRPDASAPPPMSQGGCCDMVSMSRPMVAACSLPTEMRWRPASSVPPGISKSRSAWTVRSGLWCVARTALSSAPSFKRRSG